MELNTKDFEELVYYVEAEHFIEYMGDVHCIRKTCEGCQYINECQWEEGGIDKQVKPPVRLCIGIDNELAFEKDDAYVYGINQDQQELLENEHNLRFLTDDGYLPESKNTVLKIVPETDDPWVVYNEADDNYYCIRQVCSECPKYNTCKPEIKVEKRKYVTVALDLSSQEPRCNTYVSKEPNWIQVFQNGSIKQYHTDIWELLNTVFKELGVDTDKDKVWWSWVDSMFFKDMTEGYYLYTLYVDCKLKTNSKKRRKALKDEIEYLYSNYLDFRNEHAKR